MPGMEGGMVPAGVRRSGEWIWGWTGDRRVRARFPACVPGRATLHSPTLSQEKRGVCKLKEKKREKKLLNFFPQHRRRGGTGGRRLHRDSPPAPVWRLGLAREVPGREERAWGRGAARPARGISSRRERVNFKSGFDCFWTVTLPLPAHRTVSPGPGVSLWHPPRRGVRTD